jgi:dTDP-4-amino-4,6-dideoxygalactose transaminase
MTDRIHLSPPHLTGAEERFVADAFASNWIAPLGPHVDAFEAELAAAVGMPHAVALSSGTAALHLALVLNDVGPGDTVLVSTLTFAGSVFPIRYVGATPHFIDSERTSWNMDPALLADTLAAYARRGALPKAVIAVDLYGQTADYDPITELCAASGVPLIEDAAEALGAHYRGRPAGSLAPYAIFSFNGNKIITTSGGGMLVTNDAGAAQRARKLSAQAREDFVHYEHAELGFNYRMSNIVAGIGRGQLRTLEERVRRRRQIFDRYVAALGDLPGITFMPEPAWSRSTRWLTVLTLDAAESVVSPESLRLALEAQNIEARPVWKPMHRQPVFAGCPVTDRGVADDLFARGLCLPSGSGMTDAQQDRVIAAVLAAAAPAQRRAVVCAD